MIQRPRFILILSALALILGWAALIAALDAGVFDSPATDGNLSERLVTDIAPAPSDTAHSSPPASQIDADFRLSIGIGALMQDMRSHAARDRDASPDPYVAGMNPGDMAAANQAVPPAGPSDPAAPKAEGRPAREFIAPWPPARPASLRALTTLASVSAAPETSVAPIDRAPEAAVMPPDRSGDGAFRMGSPAYVRIFKQEGQLELWLKRNGRFALFHTYAICKWSGTLGPKLKEGDYQSPEGFYAVSERQLNPHSHYDRAFDVGFPNAFDRRQGHTGGALMVHGDCKSVGCFAMTNKGIEEIYAYVDAAIKGGQREVQVHIFPFRLTEAAITKQTKGDWTSLWNAPHRNWGDFWHNLKEGYDLFEQTGEPPVAYACGDHYAFGAVGKSCTRIAGW